MALDYEIKSVRLAPSDDDSHLHIDLIGYDSPHVEGEEIMIPIARALQKMAFSEKFHVMVDGEPAEVKAGKCPTCGTVMFKILGGKASTTPASSPATPPASH